MGEDTKRTLIRTDKDIHLDKMLQTGPGLNLPTPFHTHAPSHALLKVSNKALKVARSIIL
jgi:hypothetical protein